MPRSSSTPGNWPLAASLAAATALSGVAVFTTARAGCEHPGRYETRDGTTHLVGGCLTSEDLPIMPHRERPQRAVEPALRP